MLLRTTFTAAKPVVAARLYATALGAYEARINGQRVSDAVLAPETTVAKSHILYQCHDATALIAEGENPLGAIVGDGRSEEHTSDLQSLMRNSYSDFC